MLPTPFASKEWHVRQSSLFPLTSTSTWSSIFLGRLIPLFSPWICYRVGLKTPTMRAISNLGNSIQKHLIRKHSYASALPSWHSEFTAPNPSLWKSVVGPSNHGATEMMSINSSVISVKVGNQFLLLTSVQHPAPVHTSSSSGTAKQNQCSLHAHCHTTAQPPTSAQGTQIQRWALTTLKAHRCT